MNQWLDIVSKLSVAAVLAVVLWWVSTRIWPVHIGFIRRSEKKQDDSEKRIVELTDEAHKMNGEFVKVLNKYSENAAETARQLSVVAKQLGMLADRPDQTEPSKKRQRP